MLDRKILAELDSETSCKQYCLNSAYQRFIKLKDVPKVKKGHNSLKIYLIVAIGKLDNLFLNLNKNAKYRDRSFDYFENTLYKILWLNV